MLKIDANSWHYKVWKKKKVFLDGMGFWGVNYDSHHLNLCKYFWSVLWAIFRLGFFAVVVRPVVWLFGYRYEKGKGNCPELVSNRRLAYSIFAIMCGVIILPVFVHHEVTEAFSIIVMASTLVISGVWGFSLLKDTTKSKVAEGVEKGISFFSVTTEFLRAKKSNICPLIEVLNLPENE